jgi:hypothetical protein
MLPKLGADATIQLGQPDDALAAAFAAQAGEGRPASAGLEILGMGTGTMPPMDVITGNLRELLDLLADGKLRIDIERIPLSAVTQVRARDLQGRRPVFIP